MITSQNLGATLHPVSAGGRRVDAAVALVRATAVRRKAEPALALLREHAGGEENSVSALASEMDRQDSSPSLPGRV
jgi:hypothetical protein